MGTTSAETNNAESRPKTNKGLPWISGMVCLSVLFTILDLDVDPKVKTAAWRAFFHATTPEQFQRIFNPLSIPRSAKAALFNLRFDPSTPAPAVEAVPQPPDIDPPVEDAAWRA